MCIHAPLYSDPQTLFQSCTMGLSCAFRGADMFTVLLMFIVNTQRCIWLDMQYSFKWLKNLFIRESFHLQRKFSLSYCICSVSCCRWLGWRKPICNTATDWTFELAESITAIMTWLHISLSKLRKGGMLEEIISQATHRFMPKLELENIL